MKQGNRKGRPNYSVKFKRRLTAAACEAGVSVSKPAMANAVNANMVFKWRRELRAGLLDDAPAAANVKGERHNIAPETLLRAMLLQVLYSVRSEAAVIGAGAVQHAGSLVRWLVHGRWVWVPTVFTKNRERMTEHDAIVAFLNEVVTMAEEKGWLSGEHFSVGGTLIGAWASHKSFVRKADDDHDNRDGGNFREQPRSNETHESKTDPDARLYRRSKAASELRFVGHTLSENRHGLIANAMVTVVDDHAEREARKSMIHDACQVVGEDCEIALGADKGHDAREFIDAVHAMNVLPHVEHNTSVDCSAVPDTIAGDGYAISQQKRKLIEQGFDWAKTIGPIRQVMVRGLKKVDQLFVLTMAAYNLTRMRTSGQIRLQVA